MADAFTTKKITDLTENAEVADNDLFMVGNGGTASLRKLTFAKLTGAIGKLLNPVGTIKFTADNVNPSVYLGGTWVAWGEGRVPVGVDETKVQFESAEKSGGEITTALSASQIPSHTHAVPAHAHGLNNHTHAVPVHTHTVGNQSASHDHVVNGGGCTTGTGGVHAHEVGMDSDAQKGGGTWGFHSAGVSGSTQTTTTGTNPTHSHSVPAHAHTVGNQTSSHKHTVTGGDCTAAASTGNTANSAALTSGATGGTTAHNNLQPYITCYMWKRTA